MQKRLARHQNGNGARYTRGRLPVRLLYKEPCVDKGSALKREYAIKRLKREEKIKLMNLQTKPYRLLKVKRNQPCCLPQAADTSL